MKYLVSKSLNTSAATITKILKQYLRLKKAKDYNVRDLLPKLVE